MTRIHNPDSYELIGFDLGGKKSKYIAILKNKKTGELKRIGFGMKGYQHFKDQLGHYSKYDHGDEKRRQNWLSRHKKNTDYKFSSAFFSKEILW